MKRYILGATALCLSLSACGSSPESEFIANMNSAGVKINESNAENYLNSANDYCNFSYNEYDMWNTVTLAVTEVVDVNYTGIVDAHDSYCSSIDSNWISWDVIS